MDCFGKEHGNCYGCFYCLFEYGCKREMEKNRKDDIMHMEIKITLPTKEISACTLAELEEYKNVLANQKEAIETAINDELEAEIVDWDMVWLSEAQKDYAKVRAELISVRKEIKARTEETELLAKYDKLLGDRKSASYLWAKAQLAGNRVLADNIHKDLMGTEHALADVERKLLKLRDRKFSQK